MGCRRAVNFPAASHRCKVMIVTPRNSAVSLTVKYSLKLAIAITPLKSIHGNAKLEKNQPRIVNVLSNRKHLTFYRPYLLSTEKKSSTATKLVTANSNIAQKPSFLKLKTFAWSDFDILPSEGFLQSAINRRILTNPRHSFSSLWSWPHLPS